MYIGEEKEDTSKQGRLNKSMGRTKQIMSKNMQLMRERGEKLDKDMITKVGKEAEFRAELEALQAA